VVLLGIALFLIFVKFGQSCGFDAVTPQVPFQTADCGPSLSHRLGCLSLAIRAQARQAVPVLVNAIDAVNALACLPVRFVEEADMAAGAFD
jgi:hypothetical protein